VALVDRLVARGASNDVADGRSRSLEGKPELLTRNQQSDDAHGLVNGRLVS